MLITQDWEIKLPNSEVVKLSELIKVYNLHRFRNKLRDEDTKLYELRKRRYYECFSFLDSRSELWYNELTDEQYSELKKWRQDWLDITVTRVAPIAPDWLNNHLEGEDIL